MEKEPGKARAQVSHKHPTMQHQNRVPTPRVNINARKLRRPPRVVPSETPMETTEKIKPGRPPKVTPSESPMEQQEKNKPGRPQMRAPIQVPMVTQEDVRGAPPQPPPWGGPKLPGIFP